MTRPPVLYGIISLLLLLVIPAGFFEMAARTGIAGTLPLFHSDAAWSGIILIAWLAGLFFLSMAVCWSEKVDLAFRSKGFTPAQRLQVVWNLTLMPAIIGCLSSLYTILAQPVVGGNLVLLRLFIIGLGFIPLSTYGVLHARLVTPIIVNGLWSQAQPDNNSDGGVMVRWRTVIVVVLTMVLTPFFGAGITASQVWRTTKRFRSLWYVLIVLFGLIITASLRPIIPMLKGIEAGSSEAFNALALYAILSLFSGISYAIIMRVAATTGRNQDEKK